MESFEKIAPFNYRCKDCGKEGLSGIVQISEHWSKCTGRKFYNSLIRSRRYESITESHIEQLRQKYLR